MPIPGSVHRLLLAWYRASARDFAWRRTRDPYVIMVSEIMLQQTQADRVAQLLPRFLRRFPSVAVLARARRTSVIKAWQGMGYNRRAVHLHEAAKAIIAQGGVFPHDEEGLRALPGIGAYTASAVMCFAFEQRVAVVDVNIRRVLSRLSKKRTSHGDLVDEAVAWRLAAQWLPRRAWYEWNQALMELGARICKARTAACDACPLRTICPSRNALRPAAPRTAPRAASEPIHKSVPHRIWRGRIVDALRTRRFADLRALGRAVDPEFNAFDLPVLESIVGTLVRDGLVRRTRSVITLA